MKRYNYFNNIGHSGQLDIEYVFMEYHHPILFISKDHYNNRYLCLCYEFRKVQRWLIGRIEQNDIEYMAQGEISIYEAFDRNREELYLVEYTIDKEEKCKKVRFEDLDEDILPEKDLFLDEDDYEDYINFIEQEEKQDRVYIAYLGEALTKDIVWKNYFERNISKDKRLNNLVSNSHNTSCITTANFEILMKDLDENSAQVLLNEENRVYIEQCSRMEQKKEHVSVEVCENTLKGMVLAA